MRYRRDLCRWTHGCVASTTLTRAFARQIFDAPHYERRPPSLVTRAESLARVTVEELMEENEITPRRIGGIARVIAVNWTPSTVIGQEDRDESALDLVRDFAERTKRTRSGRALDFE